MTPEERECADAMPVRWRPNGSLPPGAPSAIQLAEWEQKGWIQKTGEPANRWALTPSFLARTRKG